MKTKLLLFLLLNLTTLLHAQPANDTCATAQNITVTTSFQVVPFNTTDADVNNESGCSGDALDDYVDVWYQFVMPTAGKLSINGSVAINGFNIYDSCNGTELDCFSTTKLVENLVQGNSYILRVRRRVSQNIANFQEFYIFALEPLANDMCSNSENIVVDNTIQTISFNIVEANTNNEIGCEGESPADFKDIWYNFTMPVNGSIEINGLTSLNRFALYDSCNGTQIACFNGDATYNSYIDDLAQNENYTLRVFRSNLNNPNNQSFTIRSIEPAFPTCQNLQSITVSTTSQTINLDLSSATYDYEYGCEEVADSYTNFWYEFTMPVNGNLYINPTIYNYAAIYDTCGGTLLNCFSSNHLIDDLVQGQTYVLRIFRAQNITAEFEHFSIQAYERIVNDDCTNAEMLPTLTADNTQVQFYLAGATVNTEETCVGESDYIVDAWWQFTMPVTGNLFIDTPGGNGIAVYDTCNGTELFCNASEGSLDSFKLFDGLIEGETYLIRFFNSEQTLFDSDFQAMNLRVFTRADNDECTNPEVIPTITEISQEVTFDTFGSLINFEESCDGLPEEDFVDIWFEFTMPDFPYLNIESYFKNLFAIYDACNGNEIACFAGNSIVEGLIPNQSYVLRVFQRQSLDMFHPLKFFNVYGTNTLGVNDFDTSTMKIYPNPASSIITIDYPHYIEKVEVYSLLGKLVLQEQETKTIDVSNLSDGVYILKIYTQRGVVSIKIVKN